MKPLMLHGHERSITQIKYNTDGDLLFTASKDPTPNIWWSINGERLGTFDGHSGTVWCLDVSYDTKHCVTGAADQSMKIWDVSCGECLSSVRAKSSIRSVCFSYCGSLIAYTTDKMMGQESELRITDIRVKQNDIDDDPMMRMPITPSHSKGLSTVWGNLDSVLVTGHVDGSLIKWDVRTGKVLDTRREHSDQINDLQINPEGFMLITASKDTTARIWDLETFESLRVYKTERPVNSAAVSPLEAYPYIVLGGGQEAMEVTTTSTRVGKFDARFFHMAFEEEFGRVKGHFGPINSLAYHPSGKGYASGGEDGYIRVHNFDESYFQYKFDY